MTQKEGIKMEGNQRICCCVKSCKYNGEEGCCTLNKVEIAPVKGNATGKAEESKCSNYKCC
jgi:hypothetical protein